MDSNLVLAGLVGSIERCFELVRCEVVEVAVDPGRIEPVHPSKGRDLDLFDDAKPVIVKPPRLARPLLASLLTPASQHVRLTGPSFKPCSHRS